MGWIAALAAIPWATNALPAAISAATIVPDSSRGLDETPRAGQLGEEA